jgi:type I restriction enzyme, S subunit
LPMANTEKNLQNARELFKSYHATAISRAGAESAIFNLGDMATFRNGINYTKQSKGRSVRIIGVKDFQNHFWAPTDSLDSVTLDGDLSKADTLAEGDILSVRSNGNPELIGRCMLVGALSEPVSHSGFTIRIRLHRGDALPQYVCQLLKSPQIRRKLIDGGNGLNIKSLNQGTLSAIQIPLPPLAEQQRLIAEIDEVSEEAARLADASARKLAALEELKKSMLQQAFTGGL